MDRKDRLTIAVLGAGLIGVYVGGRLAAAGADVRLVGRPRVLDDLRTNGLRITDLTGADIAVPADRLSLHDDPSALDGVDLVILTVKSPGTLAAAAEIAAHVPLAVPVLSFQNGVSNVDQLRAALPGRTIIAGMVPYNVAQPGPGHYHRGTGGELYAADDAALAPFTTLFADAGIPLTLSSNMQAVLWGKLIINLNNAINALSGLPLAAQFSQRVFRQCVAIGQIEALRLLRRARIRPAQVLHVPTWLFPHMISLPNPLYRRLAARGGAPRIDRHARSSMADDLAKGRTTEIDYLNGEVVALAERLHKTAPVNRRIVELVRAAEAGAPSWTGDALLAELRRAR